MTKLRLTAILICSAFALAVPSVASADDFYTGQAMGQDDSLILIHAEHGKLAQVLLHVHSRCTIDGKRTDPGFGYDELKNVKVRDERFRKDARGSNPTTGLEQPLYKWRVYVAGHVVSDALKLRYETKFITNQHKQKYLCRTGLERAKLQRISKADYLDLLAETPYEPR